jgi:phage terminase large subunit-like protein
MGVKQGEMLWPEKMYDVTEGEPTPLELYVNKDARMLCMWNTQPRCPWQTKAYYASEQKVLPTNQFLRMHRNQWVTSTETFVPMEWFDACRRDKWPAIDQKRHPMIIALDAGVSSDTFGLTMGCRHPENHNDVMVWYSQKWTPQPGRTIDFHGTPDNPGPELVMERLIKEYNIIQVCYDAYQLHDLAMRHRQLGEAWFRAFNQGNDRLLADSQLRDLIRDRRFWHRGEPDLREHAQNADAKVDEQDHKIRIVKRAPNLKIDLLVCTSMMSHELLRLNL